MAPSGIGQLVLHLHRKAASEGRLVPVAADPSDPEQLPSNEAARCVAYIAGHRLSDTHSRGARLGQELRSGRLRTDEARRVRRVALSKLRDYETFLGCIDELGYTPQIIRAALTVHYEHLKSEPLGSDGNCVLLDLQAAISASSERTQQVAALLMQGFGPQQIGEAFSSEDAKANGSRLVGRALQEMSIKLSGGR